MSCDMKSGCPSWITWLLVIFLISFEARPVNGMNNYAAPEGSNQSLSSTTGWTNATTTTKEYSTRTKVVTAPTTVVTSPTTVVTAPTTAATNPTTAVTSPTIVVIAPTTVVTAPTTVAATTQYSATQSPTRYAVTQTNTPTQPVGTRGEQTGALKNKAAKASPAMPKDVTTDVPDAMPKDPTDADRGDGCKTNDRVYIIGMIVLAALLGVMHIIVAYLVYRVFKTNSLKKTGRNQEQPAASNEETNSRRESDDATGTATVMEGDKANDGGATCTVTIADVEGASDGGATSTATFKEGDKESDGGTACAVTITGGEEVNDGDATVKNGEKASDSGAACTTGPATSGEEISDGATCAAIDTPANQDEGTDVKDTSV